MDHSLPQQTLFENQISIIVLISMKIDTLYFYLPKFRKRFFFNELVLDYLSTPMNIRLTFSFCYVDLLMKIT